MPTKRVIFYIDGFNFYHGLKTKVRKDSDWRKFYWIDLVKFCQQFVEGDFELVKVKYFTASPLSIEKERRQSSLFRVNKLINGDRLDIIKGKYQKKPIRCDHCSEIFERPEEKRTDVNISVQMVGDCALQLVDKIVLISADSDLVPPIKFILDNYTDKKVSVYFPPERFSKDIFDVMNRKVVKLDQNKGKFVKSILPEVVKIEGRDYLIPDKWKC
ncbi:MAG: NYN domain-containing protein [Bacteroidota bacterium]|nr:NYN domain-containing protein [Bacteroidota bacterium]